MFIRLVLVPVLLAGCASVEEGEYNALKDQNRKSEYIVRAKSAKKSIVARPALRVRGTYPWEDSLRGAHPRITKEFFRCKGSSLHPPHKEGDDLIHDCGGIEKHSLYLREGKEFIYPILLSQLNYIQEKSGKCVVITSGYRCPEHNRYVDSSVEASSSKHMIGAEVDFYVQGLERKEAQIVKLIMQYYRDCASYIGRKEYLVFEKKGSGWCNKEIFVKVHAASEGRNFDNSHLYPYITIQVRCDANGNRIAYSWKDAFHNYLRK